MEKAIISAVLATLDDGDSFNLHQITAAVLAYVIGRQRGGKDGVDVFPKSSRPRACMAPGFYEGSAVRLHTQECGVLERNLDGGWHLRLFRGKHSLTSFDGKRMIMDNKEIILEQNLTVNMVEDILSRCCVERLQTAVTNTGGFYQYDNGFIRTTGSSVELLAPTITRWGDGWIVKYTTSSSGWCTRGVPLNRLTYDLDPALLAINERVGR